MTSATASHNGPGTASGLVLSYHRIAPVGPDPWGLRVSEALFAEQMAALRAIAEPVALRELATKPIGHNGRPRVAITFDDGYRDNFAALTHLQAHQIPATIFVATGYAGRRHFWWEVLEYVFLTPGALPAWLQLRYSCHSFVWETGAAADYSEAQHAADCRGFRWGGDPGSRIRLYFDVHEALWSLPVEARMDLAEDILAWSGMPAEGLESARPMTAEEIVAAASHDMVAIGGHSVNHPALDSLPRTAQRAQILGGQAFLEALTDRPVESFAYPHGRHDDETLAALRDGGFITACTTREEAVRPDCDPLLLPRIAVKNWDSQEFAARIHTILAA